MPDRSLSDSGAAKPARTPSTRMPSARKRMVWMLIASLVVFGGLFAVKWMGSKQMNAMFDNMPQPPATVTAIAARTESWSDTRDAVGTLVAMNGTDVTTEAGGVVRAIRFQAGDTVRQGEVLVELNTANEQATLKALEAEAQRAVAQRDRWRSLAAQNLVSRDDLDRRNADAAAAVAQVDAQRALIAQKTIRAPFSGVLGIRRISVGQYVRPGDPLVSLQAPDPILVNFSLPEQRMAQVVEGLPVRVAIDALPGRVFDGRITAIEPDVDAGTRNFTLQATLPNPDYALRPGAYAKVSMDLGAARKLVVVPQTAISFNPYGNAVYVISEAKPAAGAPASAAAGAAAKPSLTVTQRFVKTGATRGDLIAVLDGLKPGERVATSGLLKLRNGLSVIVDNAVQPGAESAPKVSNR